MSAPENLEDCYTEELADNWSANDQMREIVAQMAEAASDKRLKTRLEKAVKGIEKHTETIKQLLAELGEDEPEHCKGMEGLVREAKKHALDAKIKDPDVRDVVIVAQYQRMCHYGICGIGTAKAFAEALGRKDHAKKLDSVVADIYGTDENMTDLAERSVNLQAREAA
ncbi:ferritin-like domain-containing protein [Qipengyuania sediminis]|uniref:YciE/YciF ferroxidase family protein n=1 Tax=Qipengyuania sediminis TaxID=1532023 RepID=UPI001059D7DB|nr:ferritin-like domain-containing protein [Qipengyuania sediminis]